MLDYVNDTEEHNFGSENHQHFFRSIQLTLVVIYGFLSLSQFFHLFLIVFIIIQIKHRKNDDNLQHCLYVLALTVVDAAVLSHLPFLIIEIISTSWTFGLTMCRFFWIAESVNKILSTFILTALSWDRYLAICVTGRLYGIFRTFKVGLLIILLCVLAAFGLLSPIYTHATVGIMGHGAFPILKCVIDWSEDTEQKFTFSVFAVGYGVPLILMSYFYSRIVLKVRRNAQLFHNEAIKDRANTVTKRSFVLVSFYFFCWTPFWIMSFYVTAQQEPNDVVVIIFYFMHALVYLNSAVNPILYILFNSEFRKQTKETILRYVSPCKAFFSSGTGPTAV